MKNFRLLGLLMIIFAAAGCKRPDNLIGLNRNIHHDDFNYRVVSYERRKSIRHAGKELSARGSFLIVTFIVENNAMRVSHLWNNTIAYIKSDDGSKFENLVVAQQMLNSSEPFNWKEQYNTPHGETETTRLVFDIPAGKKNLCLQVRGYMLMGDALNLNRFKRIKIKLY